LLPLIGTHLPESPVDAAHLIHIGLLLMVMPTCCTNNALTYLFSPDPDFLQVMVAKSLKFQIVLTVFLLTSVAASISQSDSISAFYALICLISHCITLVCGSMSRKALLVASTVSFVVDAACIIMSHPETQNTIWLDFYASFPYNDGHPPCPKCKPLMEPSWVFGIFISYLLMFTIPFRTLVFALPPCFASYVILLVYARYFSGRYGEIQETVHNITVDELLLLSTTIVFAVVAKFVMESSELKLWHALHDSRKTALSEKILRCEAEFANECIKTGAEASRGDNAPSDFQQSSHSGGLNPCAPHSQASAPPVLEGIFGKSYTEDERMALRHECSHGSDCLQPDDTVWTRESPCPIPVKELLKGQHVLCYDNLGKSVKHAEVLNVVAQEGTVQWATVALVDGTSIRVTADHPFLTETDGRPRSLLAVQQKAVCARDLRPHDDKILVMKFVPVGVESINIDSSEDLKDQTRVSIEVQHPARHSVFVSPAHQLKSEHAMAVGASNLDNMGGEYSVRADKTFLNVILETPALRRNNSSPGRLQNITTTVTTTTTTMRRCSASISGPPYQSSGSDSGSSMAGPLSASSDSTNSWEKDCTIQIGPKVRLVVDASGHIAQVCSVPNKEMHASLQDYIRVKKAGIPSIGSFEHTAGRCKNACWFENQRQYGRQKRCSLGPLCDRCHFDHHFLKRGRRASNALEKGSAKSVVAL